MLGSCCFPAGWKSKAGDAASVKPVKRDASLLERLMTYGHYFPLYLDENFLARTGEVSGECGAYGKQGQAVVLWRGVSSVYILMCRIETKIRIYMVDARISPLTGRRKKKKKKKKNSSCEFTSWTQPQLPFSMNQDDQWTRVGLI